MPLYTFYPCRPGGNSDTFVFFELPDDAAAAEKALQLLEAHRSAADVAVWCDDRRVMILTRGDVGDSRLAQEGDSSTPARDAGT